MKQASYHELNPLIRARELELLSGDVLERLIQADGVEEVGEILKTTHYAPFIYPGFEHEFNQNLMKEQEELFSWLAETAPEKDVVWVYTMRFTFHNLKALTKADIFEQDLDYLFVPDGFYSIETIKEAVHSGTSNQLPDSIMDSIQEVKDYLSESKIMQGIDVIYDRHFLTEQRRLGDKLGHPELLDEILSFIDLTNIITLARGLRQKRSIGFMTTVLSSSGRIPKETLLEFVQADQTAFIQFLMASDYKDLLASALQNDTIDFGKLERIKDNFLTDKYEQAQTQAFGPLPLLAFLNAKEVERKNLQLIVAGKRSKIATTEIRERMRDVYGA